MFRKKSHADSSDSPRPEKFTPVRKGQGGEVIPTLEARRFIWTSRAYSMGLFISIVFNVVLVAVIFTLVPLKKVEPYILTAFDAKDQKVRVYPIKTGTQGHELMTFKLVRNYVRAREEIHPSNEEMGQRWGRDMLRMSTLEEYRRFRAEKETFLAEARRGGLTRLIDINSVEKFRSNVFLVEFTVKDFRVSTTPVASSRWRATIQFRYNTQEMPLNENMANDFINPIGFTVERYSLARLSG